MTQTKEEKRAYHRAWYAANKDRAAGYRRKYRATHPEKFTGYEKSRARSAEYKRRKHFRERYGCTPEYKADLLSLQGGACAICSKDISDNTRSQHLDHCHSTGTIRGVLCGLCNTALGMAKDNPATLRAMADYLEQEYYPRPDTLE
jgi:hypothetical protein